MGQGICCVPDVDAYDALCHHAMLWRAEQLIATARLLPMDAGKVVKVGRVAVAEAYRRQGLGGALMRAVQDWVVAQPGRSGVMAAQAYLAGWYAGLGWEQVGGVFIEAGIEHVTMTYRRPRTQ